MRNAQETITNHNGIDGVIGGGSGGEPGRGRGVLTVRQMIEATITNHRAITKAFGELLDNSWGWGGAENILIDMEKHCIWVIDDGKFDEGRFPTLFHKTKLPSDAHYADKSRIGKFNLGATDAAFMISDAVTAYMKNSDGKWIQNVQDWPTAAKENCISSKIEEVQGKEATELDERVSQAFPTWDGQHATLVKYTDFHSPPNSTHPCDEMFKNVIFFSTNLYKKYCERDPPNITIKYNGKVRKIQQKTINDLSGDVFEIAGDIWRKGSQLFMREGDAKAPEGFVRIDNSEWDLLVNVLDEQGEDEEKKVYVDGTPRPCWKFRRSCRNLTDYRGLRLGRPERNDDKARYEFSFRAGVEMDKLMGVTTFKQIQEEWYTSMAEDNELKKWLDAKSKKYAAYAKKRKRIRLKKIRSELSAHYNGVILSNEAVAKDKDDIKKKLSEIVQNFGTNGKGKQIFNWGGKIYEGQRHKAILDCVCGQQGLLKKGLEKIEKEEKDKTVADEKEEMLAEGGIVAAERREAVNFIENLTNKDTFNKIKAFIAELRAN